jgi:hypothetical protein
MMVGSIDWLSRSDKPREGKHPLCQRCAPVGGEHRALQEFLRTGISRQAPTQQIEAAADHHQQIVEVMRDTGGEPADALHLLELDHLGGALFHLVFQIGVHAHQRLGCPAFACLAATQPSLGLPEFGDVAPDEKVLLLRLRPDTGPAQGHDPPMLVDVAAIEIAGQPAAPRLPHLIARTLQVLGIKEVGRTVADHLVGVVAEGRLRARTYPHKRSATVDDEYEVQRCFKDPLIDRVFALARWSRDRARCGLHRSEIPPLFHRHWH